MKTTILLAAAVALSGCGGASSSSLGSFAPTQAASRVTRASSTPIPFSYTTVDDPLSNVNAVTGINSVGEISGTIGNGSVSDPYQGYSSLPPYSLFVPIVYTSALGTYVTSLSASASNPIFAGYVISPPQLIGTWGFVDINLIPTLLKDHKEGKGSNAVTEVLGINDSQFGVGFYKGPSGTDNPVVIDIASVGWTQLNPPGMTGGGAATGINSLNHIVGWAKKHKKVMGFLLRAGTYYTIAYPQATATEARGVTTNDQIVGYYTDTKGNKHGFIETNATTSKPVWQKIDDPSADGVTVVTGVNDSDDITGYYVDSSGVQHGFVAVP